MINWLGIAVTGAVGAILLLVGGDLAYREFYIKPLGVAFLVKQFPEIVSRADMITASPEMMVLSPVAFEPDCQDWIWGCYSAEAYRRVKHVYVGRQHGGLNEVIPCAPGSCADGSDFQIRELSREESQAVGQQGNAGGDILDDCHSKTAWAYEMQACRQDSVFDGNVVTSSYVLRTTIPLSLRFFVDNPWTPEIQYHVNYVSGSKHLVGGSKNILW